MDFKEQNERILNAIRYLKEAKADGNGKLDDAKGQVIAEFLPWLDNEALLTAKRYNINLGIEDIMSLKAVYKFDNTLSNGQIDYSRNEYQIRGFIKEHVVREIRGQARRHLKNALKEVSLDEISESGGFEPAEQSFANIEDEIVFCDEFRSFFENLNRLQQTILRLSHEGLYIFSKNGNFRIKI